MPLTIILGMAQQAHSNPKKFLDKGLRLIKKNAHHLMNLVNQMLDLSKLEAGHVELNLIQNDIVPYLNVLLEPFQYLASQKQIGFHILVDEDEIWMDYDKKNIEIVVTNLVTNALKNSDQGDEVFVLVGRSNRKAMMFDNMYSPLRNKKEYLLKGSDEYLQIIVKDTGRGIAKMDLHNIFERFYQVEKDVRFSGEGSGVGLVIVKELTRLMQGDILVKSKPGVGSEFILILPLTTDAPRVYKANDVKSGSNEILIKEDAQGLVKQSKKIPQLLIIEDFPDMVDYIKSFVDKEFHVQVASDGDQGIKKALELIPDLIITDVMMPGKDGYEVCNQLKNDIRTSHIPIIMLTAKANEASKIKGYRQGADAYITKPFNAEELKIRLQNLIESRKKLQEKYRRIIMLGQLKNEDPTHPDEKFLNDLISILSKKFSEEDFGVQEFTREIGMSRVQLYRKLKAITGLSASDFIRSYRLNIAKEMIPKSGLNISEIAYEVGFKDPAYFTRAFKKEFGYAPSSIKND
jgi:CheY-like chemotaxis protein